MTRYIKTAAGIFLLLFLFGCKQAPLHPANAFRTAVVWSNGTVTVSGVLQKTAGTYLLRLTAPREIGGVEFQLANGRLTARYNGLTAHRPASRAVDAPLVQIAALLEEIPQNARQTTDGCRYRVNKCTVELDADGVPRQIITPDWQAEFT